MDNIWGSAPRGNDVSLDPADVAQFGTREHQLAVNGYYPTYNPGTAFANQCRTTDNPDGWVYGSGGYTSRPRISAMWYALSDDEKRIQLQHGQDLRDQGYVCPKAPGAAVAASPFFNAPSALPASSPYYVPPGTVFVAPQTVEQAKAAVQISMNGQTNKNVVTPNTNQNSPVNSGNVNDVVNGFLPTGLQGDVMGIPIWMLLGGIVVAGAIYMGGKR